MTITHGSLFAGIEGFGIGFRQVGGFDTRWCVEIDAQCRRVLAHHFSDAYLHDDVTTAGAHNLAPVDVITFGFPCTDLSVAGKRAGLAGAASGLFWEAMRVIKELRPTVIVAENVPGLLNSHGGRDMAAVLWGIRDAGYGDVGWAVLDSQWRGVAQRRKRVFIVGSAGTVSPAEVLAFSDGLSGHPAPSRAQREEVAGTLGGGSGRRGWSPDTDRMTFVAQRHDEWDATSVASTLAARDYKSPRVLATGMAYGLDSQLNSSEEMSGPLISTGGSRNQFVAVAVPILEASGRRSNVTDSGLGVGHDGDPMYTLQASQQHGVMAFDLQQVTSVANRQRIEDGRPAPTLHQAGGAHAIVNTAVRRLTPTETLRLQGFPDDHLDLDPPLSDSAKYRMTGNAVTVNVAEYLGRNLLAAMANTRCEEVAGE